ncbi:branched-chain amino acid transport system substrate-binding protein [Enhydrobacter aerosaccus]|uniref:Branched-chain amino acid transport system substrate-binding protein n=1 Tax=Enhydrobacter aerosaccus TaxID=225324 RepID=A0A1T4NWW8_9HYPH|nr:amino acid ABC transporter substrate-binding protein [Enhydrobacter aerosaccus]SJZ83739.1 branched-chain amino acid transport system substrate-binding protein [Enhydrobacter aerosaccus]
MRMERRTFGKLAVAGTAASIIGKASAQNKPLTIGFGMALTGSLAPNGKSALLGMQIWEEDVNARGGLLGRPVKLVYYDDASNPSNVPGIYTKLLDVDKVDIVTSGYATNMVAPAMPIVMQHDRTFFSLLGLAVNSEFHYPRYFSITPTGGPNPKESFSQGFFAVAMEQNPKPQTVALTGADAEFPRNALDGVRAQLKKLGLKIVYDKTYPPNTADYTPVVRAVAATNPDIYFSASYPADTVGIIRAAHEIGFKPKLFGGGMVGLQATAIKTQLGPLLNGIVTYDFWLPWAGFATDEGRELIKKYQARSAAAGVDLLGYYLPPFGYALCQVVEQAVKATGGTNDDKLAEYARKNTFKTVAGDIRFNAEGEWEESQVMAVQFQGITSNSVDQFRDPKTEVILWPTKYRTGNIIYPYDPSK